MILNLTADWRIRTDKYNWIVERHYVRKSRTSNDDQDHWRPMAYYTSPWGALKKAIDLQIRMHDIELTPAETAAFYEWLDGFQTQIERAEERFRRDLLSKDALDRDYMRAECARAKRKYGGDRKEPDGAVNTSILDAG